MKCKRLPMEKTRFAIISDLLQLSHGIRASLKVADGLACDGSKDESVRKEAFREIKRNLKAVPLCLSGIRDYIAEHDDRDLARQFVALLDDTKRLHDFCVALHPELKAEAYRSGIAYATMEVIGQYFFPDKDTDKGTDGKRKPMTRAEATDCIDIIRATIRKCTAMADANKGKEDVASEAYTSLAHIGRNEIEAVKEYITTSQTPTTRIWPHCSRRTSQKPSTFPWCSETAIPKRSRQGLRCSISP